MILKCIRCRLKDKFTPPQKTDHLVRKRSQAEERLGHISGASQQNSIATFSSTTEVDEDFNFRLKHNNKKINLIHTMAPNSSSGIIKVSGSLEIPELI